MLVRAMIASITDPSLAHNKCGESWCSRFAQKRKSNARATMYVHLELMVSGLKQKMMGA